MKPIIYEKRIYESDVETLYDVLKNLDDKYKTVFIFGHNPGLNMLVESLVDFHDNIPTCGVIELEFDCKKNRDITPTCTKLISFDYPKKYN